MNDQEQHWAAAKRRYWERGWTVVEGVFAAERVAQVAALAQEIGYRDLQRTPASEVGDYLFDRAASGATAPRKIGTPYTRHADFRALVFDPRLRALLEAVIGAPVELAADQILMKPPEIGSAKPYHQDNAYFRCDPGDHVVTAWIALDDVDEENGCLRYIDGSHRQPDPPARAGARRAAQQGSSAGGDRARPLEHPRVDRAGRHRRGGAAPQPYPAHLARQPVAALAARLRTHWAAADVTSASGFVENAYFNRPGYPDHDA